VQADLRLHGVEKDEIREGSTDVKANTITRGHAASRPAQPIRLAISRGVWPPHQVLATELSEPVLSGHIDHSLAA
jgi:hypothetical protein